MNIRLGRDTVSMLNPPNIGEVQDNARTWNIGRAGNGNIMLRAAFCSSDVHPDFLPDGMDMRSFCEWINAHERTN